MFSTEPRPKLREDAFSGTRPLVVCLVGAAGVGKTSLIRRMQLDERPQAAARPADTIDGFGQMCTLEYNTQVDLERATGDRRRVAVTVRDVHGPFHSNVRYCPPPCAHLWRCALTPACVLRCESGWRFPGAA